MTPADRAQPDVAPARLWLAAALLVVAGMIAYGNSLAADFVFDDHTNILHNDYVNGVRPMFDDLLQTRRIVGRLSMAANYACFGPNAVAFHAVNLAIHLAAALTLMGIARRTLQRCHGFSGDRALSLALAIAGLWLVHPLNTQAVTYVVQRFESLMGLLFLTSIYCLIRAADARRSWPWLVAAWLACGAAIATKEVAIVLPVVLILFDRAFLAGTFAQVLRRRWHVHAAGLLFFALPFLFGVSEFSRPTGAAGFGLSVLSPRQYALSQPGVILFYLRLAFWPDLLCIDHFWPIPRTAWAIVPPAVIVLGLGALTLVALWRWPRLGFLGAAFFLVLAPSSSFIPIFDLAVEHRMYLPLIAVVALTVLAVHRCMAILAGADPAMSQRAARLQWALLIAAAAALATRTMLRNLDYRSELTLWRDAVVKRPNNPRAHRNLSALLAKRGDLPGAADAMRRSLAIFPADPEGQRSLARMLHDQGQIDAALAQFRVAQSYAPKDVSIPLEVGGIHLRRNQARQAADAFAQALAIDPSSVNAWFGSGDAALRLQQGQGPAMIEKAVELSSDKAEAHGRAGRILAAHQRLDEARPHLEAAARLNPDDADAWSSLGNLALSRGDSEKAVSLQRRAVQLDPGNAELARRLASALSSLPTATASQRAEALRLAVAAAQRNPGSPAFLDTAAQAFAAAGQHHDAARVLRRLQSMADRAGQANIAADFHRRAQEQEAKAAAMAPAPPITTTSPAAP